ncbi:hypothetical protein BP5796_13033 [Coleophoma crateriformis]|uniref:Uncharacterized protein n=1 Tax=Coleophoma crateriformis TaxID=565419 RepID=A0A3D8Q571_9HELO|nr:hypothetical protein BP5796_13033 [Coleophoma crateriformis]
MVEFELVPDTTKASLYITFPELDYVVIELNSLVSQDGYTDAICSRLRELFCLFSKDPLVRAVLISIDTTTELDTFNPMALWVPELNPDPNTGKQGSDFMLEAIRNCSKPIICVNHGKMSRTNLQIASASSIRICTSDSRFCIRDDEQVDNKLVDVLQEILQTTENKSLLRQFVLTGKPFPADVAKQLGFVSGVWKTKSEALDEGRRLAKAIAERRVDVVQKLAAEMKGSGKPGKL